MIESSRTDLEVFIQDQIEGAKRGKRTSWTTLDELTRQFDQPGRQHVTYRALAAALAKYGAVNLGEKRVDGMKRRFWALTGDGEGREIRIEKAA